MAPAVSRRKRRYQLTRALVTQSMLGVFIRMGVVKANVGTRNELTRIGVATQSVTVLEQFLRLVLELEMDEKPGGRGTFVIESVEGLDAAVALGASAHYATDRSFQSAASIQRMAEMCGIEALAEFLERNRDRIELLFGTRHALTHTVGIVEFDEAALYETPEAICGWSGPT